MKTTETQDNSFEWSSDSSHFVKYFSLLTVFKEKHGDCHVPKNYIVDGQKLGDWASHAREARSQGRLSAEAIKKLDDIGFPWGVNKSVIVTPKTKKIRFELSNSDFINDRFQLPVEVLLPENKVEFLTLTLTKNGDITLK